MSPTAPSPPSKFRSSTPVPPPPFDPPVAPFAPPVILRESTPPSPSTGRATIPPPPPPASPPPAPPRRRIPDVSAWPLALWLSLLGSGLMACAALVVGFAGRNTLGAFGPAAGLAGAAAATCGAARRMRRPAPIVAGVLDHLARLETAVGATAVVGALAPWPVVVAAFGVTLALASYRWRLGGTWGCSVVRSGAVGSVLVATAAATWLPLGVLLGMTACAVMGVALAPRRPAQVIDAVAVLLAGAALAAPLGGWPGSVRFGPGTLARLGLRGDQLPWAAPMAGVLAGLALLAWAHRHRSRTAAFCALSGLGANVLIGLGTADLTRWTQAIWTATIFAVLQAAARATGDDDFCDHTIGTVARVTARWGLPALGIVQLGVLIDTVNDGRSTTAAVIPLLIGLGYVLAPPVPPKGLTSIAAGVSAVVALLAATGSVAVVAAAGVAALIVLVALTRESATRGAAFVAAAVGAWLLTVAAQVIDAGLFADGLAVVALVTAGVGIPRRARADVTLLVVTGAAVSAHAASWAGGSVPRYTAAIVAAAVAGLVLLVFRRADAAVPAGAVLTLALPALGQVVSADPALADGFRSPFLADPASQGALAALFVAVIGAAAWVRGTPQAAHLVAAAAVLTVGSGALALGAPREWIVGTGVLVGIAVAGISFIRSTYGPGDTVALSAALVAFAFGIGQPATSTALTLAWLAATALGTLVTLHGLCRLDAVLATTGAVVAAVSAVMLAVLTDTPQRVLDGARAVGMSSADIAVTLVVLVLAGTGVAVDRFARSANSWTTFGPAATVASAHLLVTIAVAGHADVRVLVAITLSLLSIVVGALARRAAPLVIGTVTVVGTVLLASWATLVALPTWVWMAVGGASLLAVAAGVERRSRSERTS